VSSALVSVLGPTGLGRLDAGDTTFTFLADIGFALVMFVAGSRVPVRDRNLRAGLRTGALRAVAVGVPATALGVVIAYAFGTGHAAMYAVLTASSSAALVLPIVDSLHLGGPHVLRMLSQVAIADTASTNLTILFALAALAVRTVCRSCWPASRSGSPSRPSASRAGWPGNCSR
jgi:Kef-type K+ transport system membrane component KefB